MENLLRAMQLIDEHSSKIPEGDYLEICNNLKSAYNKRSDPVLFFDYENFRIAPMSDNQHVLRYFNNYFIDRAVEIDSDFVHIQMNYLESELSNHQPIRRISKPLRERVLRHYYRIYTVEPDDRPDYFDKSTITKFCRSYIELENEFRSRYRDAIVKRLHWLEDSNDNLNEI